RAARNVNGKAIMYADKITDSMQRTIDETNYKREKQHNYNIEHGLVPMSLNKKIEKNTLGKSNAYKIEHAPKVAAEPDTTYMTKVDIEKIIRDKRKSMEKAAKELDFLQAAKLRDEIKALQEKV
ncbi:MAG: excinuclease ABC subunit B, partial [Flavobacterium sp.]